MSLLSEIDNLENNYKTIDDSRKDIVKALNDRNANVSENLRFSEVVNNLNNVSGGGLPLDPIYADFISSGASSFYQPFVKKIEFKEGNPYYYLNGQNEWMEDGWYSWDITDNAANDWALAQYNAEVALVFHLTDFRVEIIFTRGYELKTESLNSVFSRLSELEEIDICALNVDETIDFEMVFAGCPKLKTIYCNTDWTEVNPEVKEYPSVFAGCTALQQAFPDVDDLSGNSAKPSDLGGFFTRKN